MGAKNVVTKQYIADNEKFADLFNYLIYNGERVIQPNQLQEKDSEELLNIQGEGFESVQTEEKFRDVLKECVVKQTDDKFYIIMGVENQSEIHYAMPVRNLLYDAIDYTSQVQEIAKDHRKKGDLKSGAEFLSGFRKCDKIKPVITLVIYFHEGDWDGPRSLHEMLNTEDENILQYVSDYKLNIIVPKEVEHPEKFRTNFRDIIEYMKVADDKEKLKRLRSEENGNLSHVDKEVALVLQECLGAKFEIKEEEETVNLCKGLQDLADEAREEGRLEMALKYYTKGYLPLNDALEETGLTKEKFESKVESYMADQKTKNVRG